MVKRHEFLESLDACMDDEEHRVKLRQIIRPVLAEFAECARRTPDRESVAIGVDQVVGVLAEVFLQCVAEGMRAGAEWAGVRCGFAGAGSHGGINTAIDQAGGFLVEAFHQGESRARAIIAASQAMKAGEVGGRA